MARPSATALHSALHRYSALVFPSGSHSNRLIVTWERSACTGRKSLLDALRRRLRWLYTPGVARGEDPHPTLPPGRGEGRVGGPTKGIVMSVRKRLVPVLCLAVVAGAAWLGSRS